MRDKWTFRCDVSAPTQDPYLLIDFINQNHSLLFDCGVRIWGKMKTLLKLEALFISHAHIDHMIGFDHIIRSLLGESKHLDVYGPQGMINRIAAKLGGYDWDRAADQQLVVRVHEISDKLITSCDFECRKQFIRSNETQTILLNNVIRRTKDYEISFTRVDHGGSPCLAYAFQEFDRLRIDKGKMDLIGLKPGPWVGDLLRLALKDPNPGTMLEINGKSYEVDELKREILRVQHGIKVAYVTDTVLNDLTRQSVADLVAKADLLICESTFLDEDLEFAKRYHHITAIQAGMLANAANVKKLVLFHISNRYLPDLHRVVREARSVFSDVELSSQFMKPRRSGTRRIPASRESE